MNYYEILGLKPGAGADAIRRAYLDKVRLVHPDINPSPDAQQQFILLKQAYDVLSDENKRAVYDQKLKQLGSTQQNIKNFHYDFESNFPEKGLERNKPANKVVMMAIILGVLMMLIGAVISFMLTK